MREPRASAARTEARSSTGSMRLVLLRPGAAPRSAAARSARAARSPVGACDRRHRGDEHERRDEPGGEGQASQTSVTTARHDSSFGTPALCRRPRRIHRGSVERSCLYQTQGRTAGLRHAKCADRMAIRRPAWRRAAVGIVRRRRSGNRKNGASRPITTPTHTANRGSSSPARACPRRSRRPATRPRCTRESRRSRGRASPWAARSGAA